MALTLTYLKWAILPCGGEVGQNPIAAINTRLACLWLVLGLIINLMRPIYFLTACPTAKPRPLTGLPPCHPCIFPFTKMCLFFIPNIGYVRSCPNSGWLFALRRGRGGAPFSPELISPAPTPGGLATPRRGRGGLPGSINTRAGFEHGCQVWCVVPVHRWEHLAWMSSGRREVEYLFSCYFVSVDQRYVIVDLSIFKEVEVVNYSFIFLE